MKLAVLKSAILGLGLIGLTSSVVAEQWNFFEAGSNSGDPMTFTGDAGTLVTVTGFTVDSTSGLAAESPAKAKNFGGNGLGVEIDGNDPHTVGNNNPDHFDGIVFDFGNTLADLSRIRLLSSDRWTGSIVDDNDQDHAVYYWGASGDATLPGSSYNQLSGAWDNWIRTDLTNSGVDNNSNTANNGYNINGGGAQSTTWMVLAANSDTILDAFKIKWVRGDVTPCTDGQPGCGGTPVPVPGTLVLLSLGLLGARRFMTA